MLLFRFHLRSTSALRTPRSYGQLDNTESNETTGNTIYVIRELLHSALLHYASEKFLHFALNTLLHFASMLLDFALVLHFAAILITLCDDYYILRRNSGVIFKFSNLLALQ